jgi:hypothetical protein
MPGNDALPICGSGGTRFNFVSDRAVAKSMQTIDRRSGFIAAPSILLTSFGLLNFASRSSGPALSQTRLQLQSR